MLIAQHSAARRHVVAAQVVSWVYYTVVRGAPASVGCLGVMSWRDGSCAVPCRAVLRCAAGSGEAVVEGRDVLRISYNTKSYKRESATLCSRRVLWLGHVVPSSVLDQILLV